MGSSEEKSEITQRQKERFCFIEQQLYWNSKLSRNILSEGCGVSESQATMDIKAYQVYAPGNLQYDLGKKYYLPSATFGPKFWKPDPQKYLSGLMNNTSDDLPDVERPPSFDRSVPPEVLRDILDAIRNENKLNISYQSPRRLEKTKRWIYPLTFAFTEGRWHLRAYCLLRNDFRSFVLGRILSVDDTLPGEDGEAPHDNDWNTYVVVKIIPSKKLRGYARASIEQDFKMKKGLAEVSVRKALLQYFLSENQLLDTKFAEIDDESSLICDNGMIAVQNYEEVQGYLS